MWLNWACLGSDAAGKDGSTLEANGEALRAALLGCIRWTANWMSCPESTVVLTSSATEGCELALRLPCLRDVTHLFHTNHAHPTVRGSVERAARYLGSITKKSVQTHELNIDEWLLEPADAFASHFAQKVAGIADGKPCVVVVEHVTSSQGLLLPIEEIDVALRRENLSYDLVIDGAQAVGLWPPPNLKCRAYFGGFHKYVNASPGTGFVVLPELDMDWLPHYAFARTVRAISEEEEVLPTQEVTKWVECHRGLTESSSVPERVSQILAFRQILLESIQPLKGTPDLRPGSPYASHIVSINCHQPERASLLWQELARRDYHVKLQGSSLRLTLHHSFNERDIRDFGLTLRQLYLCLVRS